MQTDIFCLKNLCRCVLCESLVLSYFNYCSFVYGHFLNVLENRKIQRVQNSCFRFVCSLRKYDHVSNAISELNWLNMNNRRKLHFAVFVHKIMVSESPSFLKNRLIPRNATHDRNTRYNSMLSIPKHTTAIFRRCFSYQAAHTYNTLSNDLKILSPVNFNRRYKLQLLAGQ